MRALVTGWALALMALWPHAAAASTLRAPAVAGAAARALARAEAGDTVLLAHGRHTGPLRIERAITLRGEPGAIVAGGGAPTVLTVTAGGATVEDLALEGSG